MVVREVDCMTQKQLAATVLAAVEELTMKERIKRVLKAAAGCEHPMEESPEVTELCDATMDLVVALDSIHPAMFPKLLKAQKQ